MTSHDKNKNKDPTGNAHARFRPIVFYCRGW